MEQTATYKVAILKKIRDLIISCLKGVNYNLGKQYNLSTAQPDTASFELRFLIKREEVSQKIWVSTVINAVDKTFGQKDVTYERKDGLLTVNVKAVYEKMIAESGEEKEEVSVAKPENTGAGRPRTEASLLETELLNILTLETNVRLGQPGSGVVIIPRRTGENFVTLSFSNEAAFNVALSCIEKGYGDAITIKETAAKRWIFAVSADGKPLPQHEAVIRTRAKDFHTLLQRALLEMHKQIKVLTPYLVIAQHNNSIVKVELMGSVNFLNFAHEYVAEKFPTAKREGTVITFSATDEEKQKAIDEGLVFIKINHAKGVTINEVEKNGVIHHSYTHVSTDYEEFHFLSFNRTVTKDHVNDLVESITSFGILRFVVVAETRCIDGTLKKWIVDGQHLLSALKIKGLPVLYVKVEVTTKEEMVHLIARLNSTSRKWVLKDYLKAWVSLEIDNYSFLEEQQKKTKLPLTLLMQICENKPNAKSSTASFLEGKFSVVNKERAARDVMYIVDAQKYVTKNRDIASGLFLFIRKMGDQYLNDRMILKLKNIKKSDLPFRHGDELAEITDKFEMIYRAA